MKRWLWILSLAALVILGIVWGLRDHPVPVEAARVTVAPMRVTVEEEGKTRLKSRYVVSAPVSGFMNRLRVKAGDPVRSGEVLTRLSPITATLLDTRTRDTSEARLRVAESVLEVARARVLTLEEQLRSAQADQDYWKRERDRENVLVKSGDLPAQRLDRTATEILRSDAAVAAAKRAIETARREVESAAAEVSAARAALKPALAPAPTANGGESVAVTIPASGRVIRVVQESEGVVMPGTPLIEIGNANAIEVEVEVLSPDAVRLAPGTRVLLGGWGGPELEARVRVVEPGGFTKVSALGVEEQRVRVIADIIAPENDWKRLGDGYRVEASFILWEGGSVLQIPANALFRYQNGWAVFVIEGGMARRKTVEPGHRTGVAAEIVSGLKDGDTVIAHPDETVEEGKKVVAK